MLVGVDGRSESVRPDVVNFNGAAGDECTASELKLMVFSGGGWRVSPEAMFKFLKRFFGASEGKEKKHLHKMFLKRRCCEVTLEPIESERISVFLLHVHTHTQGLTVPSA